ncbi:hypothetical protein NST74_27085 [Paenibacillus sp. FSL F4-0125]|uniref:hypothetical protein n=1 Tax=Paenibacillus sp. FSL F4-0125 TaxID=2954730 RepID=UPI0030F63844
MSKSSVYKWQVSESSEREKRKEDLVKRVKWYFYDSDGTYGSPRIRNKLVKRTVGIIMREHSLRSCMSREFKVATTDSKHDHPVAPNVLKQDFKVTKTKR